MTLTTEERWYWTEQIWKFKRPVRQLLANSTRVCRRLVDRRDCCQACSPIKRFRAREDPGIDARRDLGGTTGGSRDAIGKVYGMVPPGTPPCVESTKCIKDELRCGTATRGFPPCASGPNPPGETVGGRRWAGPRQDSRRDSPPSGTTPAAVG